MKTARIPQKGRDENRSKPREVNPREGRDTNGSQPQEAASHGRDREKQKWVKIHDKIPYAGRRDRKPGQNRNRISVAERVRIIPAFSHRRRVEEARCLSRGTREGAH